MFSSKTQALRREGFRCLISHHIDFEHQSKFPGAKDRVGFTHCAHIVPDVLNFDLDKTTEVRKIFSSDMNLY
jgi:hypothetical protein